MPQSNLHITSERWKESSSLEAQTNLKDRKVHEETGVQRHKGESEPGTDSTASGAVGSLWTSYSYHLVQQHAEGVSMNVHTEWMERPSRLSYPHLKYSHCTWSPALHCIRAPVPRITLTLVSPETAARERHKIPFCASLMASDFIPKPTLEISGIEANNLCSHRITHSQGVKDQH